MNYPNWPIILYFFSVLGIVLGMAGVSFILGQRHGDRTTRMPYESGIASTGSARIRVTIHFYLIAMFFVIFDLEAVYIFLWSSAVLELGWTGYIEITVFILILMATLFYLTKLGALDWGPSAQRRFLGKE